MTLVSFVAGLSEYGIQVIDWLISRGATKIVALSQYKPVTGYQCLAVRRWKSKNVNVNISNVDASTPDGAESSIQTAMLLGPVGGIFIIGPVSFPFNLYMYSPFLVFQNVIRGVEHLCSKQEHVYVTLEEL